VRVPGVRHGYLQRRGHSDQLGKGLCAHFFHDFAAMNLQGDLGDAELSRRLFVEKPAYHQRQHLELPRGQRREPLMQLDQFRPSSPGAAILLQCCADGLHEVRLLERFGQEVDCTGLDRTHGGWNVTMSRDEDNVRVVSRRHLSLEIEPIDVGKLDVQDQARGHVRLRAGPVFRGGTQCDRMHIEAGKQVDQRCADAAVVIEDENDVVFRIHNEGPSRCRLPNEACPSSYTRVYCRVMGLTDTIVQSMQWQRSALMINTSLNGRAAMSRRSRNPIAGLALLVSVVIFGAVEAAGSKASEGTDAAPYPDMPKVAPIGERIGQYLAVPAEAKGPPVDPAKGYRLQELGKGLYMITDNVYQSVFMTYENGVVVVDAPPGYASHIVKAIREVSDKRITHLIYSHSHVDHIAGTKALGSIPTIIAQEETKRLLVRAKDPNRPLPTVTFKDRYSLEVGSQVLELSYHGDAHEPGNIFVYAPAQQTLMVVDMVFPGWMPWRRFAVAHDVPGYFAQLEEIRKVPFQTLVGGHVARTGTRADVDQQIEFMSDLKTAATKALSSTKPGEGMDAAARDNPWALFDDYIDRVAIQCVNELTAKWSGKLAAFDVYIWDQCYAMEQSLRID
jgi:glyoxylase-like metal-dependent hydrolase (beta-lactamase superfamily II)